MLRASAEAGPADDAGVVRAQLYAFVAGPNPADLVTALALPVPSLVICQLLGLPYADHDFFQRASRALISRSTLAGVSRAAQDELLAYLDHLIGRKLAAPGRPRRLRPRRRRRGLPQDRHPAARGRAGRPPGGHPLPGVGDNDHRRVTALVRPGRVVQHHATTAGERAGQPLNRVFERHRIEVVSGRAPLAGSCRERPTTLQRCAQGAGGTSDGAGLPYWPASWCCVAFLPWPARSP